KRLAQRLDPEEFKSAGLGRCQLRHEQLLDLIVRTLVVHWKPRRWQSAIVSLVEVIETRNSARAGKANSARTDGQEGRLDLKRSKRVFERSPLILKADEHGPHRDVWLIAQHRRERASAS